MLAVGTIVTISVPRGYEVTPTTGAHGQMIPHAPLNPGVKKSKIGEDPQKLNHGNVTNALKLSVAVAPTSTTKSGVTPGVLLTSVYPRASRSARTWFSATASNWPVMGSGVPVIGTRWATVSGMANVCRLAKLKLESLNVVTMPA